MARFRQLWSFSKWIIVGNLGSYGLIQVDKFLVGRRTDAAIMGQYSLADDIAAMPTTELLSPLSRVLFPVFVDSAHDPEKLRSAFCKAIGVQSLIALPAGVGLCVIAGDAVLLLLGERWERAVPLIQTLALINIFSALSYSSSYLLLALGKVSVQAYLTWLRVGLMVFFLIAVFPEAGAQGIADIRLASTAIGFMVFVNLVLHYAPSVRLRDLIEHAWRPLLSTGVMALSLSIFPRLDSLALLLQVILSVAFGAGVYICSILALWRISGCCDGAEAYLLEQLRIKERIVSWMRCRKCLD
jgi:O-antigen/teichoic acid export membrane protein